MIAALGACANDDIDEDGRDDTFAPDGKADSFLVSPQEASAILQVANTASASTLRYTVTIAKRTVDQIVAARAQKPFATLADLDAVPYVGPVALHKLLDYVRAADLAQQAGGAKQWHEDIVGNGIGQAMAISPSGELMIVYARDYDHMQLRRGNGVVIDLPPEQSYDGYPLIAIDKNNDPHVFYKLRTSGLPLFRHRKLSAGTWITYASFTAGQARVDQSRDGKIFALAVPSLQYSGYRFPELITIEPDGTTSSDTLAQSAIQPFVDLEVGADGTPGVAYYDAQDGYHYVVKRAGVLNSELLLAHYDNEGPVATTGGESPTVLVAPHFDAMHVLRKGPSGYENGGTMPAEDGNWLDVELTPDGVTHACFLDQGKLYHVQVDASGVSSKTALHDVDDYVCQLAVAPDGTLHMLYSTGNVITHATFQ